MASYLHHTATTVYPCCVPTLGDSTGAGCVGLATAKIRPFKASARNFSNHFCFFYAEFKAKKNGCVLFPISKK